MPGGVVAHWASETDHSGRVVRRSTLELIDYGLPVVMGESMQLSPPAAPRKAARRMDAALAGRQFVAESDAHEYALSLRSSGMRFIEMTGKTLKRLIAADELHAGDLASTGVDDDTIVRINRQGDIEVRRTDRWDVIGGLLGNYEQRIKSKPASTGQNSFFRLNFCVKTRRSRRSEIGGRTGWLNSYRRLLTSDLCSVKLAQC